MKRSLPLIFLFFALVSIDQILKYAFAENSVCNKNLAWSIPIAPGVFYFLWIIIFFLLVYFFAKNENKITRWAIIIILAGAISNLLNRIFHGCVVDFIDLKIWPIFNLADIYIAIGIVALIAGSIRRIKSQSSNNK